MKKTVSIAFLFILLISQFGHGLVYIIQEWEIRNEVFRQIVAGLPESSLEVIEDDANLKWEEPGKEFYHHGELFDVVKTRELNGRTYYYCLNDKKENQLKNNFDKFIKAGNGRNNGNKLTQKFQVSDFTIPAVLLMKLESDLFQVKYFGSEDNIISLSIEIVPSPPWS